MAALNDVSDDVDALAFDASGSSLVVGAGFFGSISAFGANAPRAQVGVEYDTPNDYDMVSLTVSSSAKLIAGGENDCGCVVVCKQ